MARPPRHAWDWMARQRLLWRHVRTRLATKPDPIGTRYRLIDSRGDVMARLRADYAVDAEVAEVVRQCVSEDVFLGHAHRGLDGLGITNAPRGLRWWWQEVVDHGQQDPRRAVPPARPAAAPPRPDPTQLALDIDAPSEREQLDDVRTGWGD